MRLHNAFKILIPLQELKTKISEYRTKVVLDRVERSKHWMKSVENLTPSDLIISFLEAYQRDFDLNLFVFEYEKELYGVASGAEWMLQQLAYQEWTEDFSYTDSCDRPSGLKKKEWDKRAEVWDALIPYRARIEECGYKIEVLNQRTVFNVLKETKFLDEILSIVPTI